VSQKPEFIEFALNAPEIPSHLKSFEKKFWMRCNALGKSAIEGGPTKKAAKHEAATIVLRKVQVGSDDSDSDGDAQKCQKEDYVTDLLNFCVQKNYHKPLFTCIDSYGPSHDPRFIFECRLDSIVKRAEACTKTQSKHMAAKAVLDVVKSVKI
jgi:dsRNA-specific ribonuclease